MHEHDTESPYLITVLRERDGWHAAITRNDFPLLCCYICTQHLLYSLRPEFHSQCLLSPSLITLSSRGGLPHYAEMKTQHSDSLPSLSFVVSSLTTFLVIPSSSAFDCSPPLVANIQSLRPGSHRLDMPKEQIETVAFQFQVARTSQQGLLIGQ